MIRQLPPGVCPIRHPAPGTLAAYRTAYYRVQLLHALYAPPVMSHRGGTARRWQESERARMEREYHERTGR